MAGPNNTNLGPEKDSDAPAQAPAATPEKAESGFETGNEELGEQATDVASGVVEAPNDETGLYGNPEYLKFKKELEKAGGDNDLTKKLEELGAEFPSLVDSKVYWTLMLFAAKYGNMFGAISDYGKTMDDKLAEPEYAESRVYQDDAQKMNSFDMLEELPYIPIEGEEMQASSCRYVTGYMFGEIDEFGNRVFSDLAAISDPYEFAAKMHNGYDNADGSYTLTHEKFTNKEKIIRTAASPGTVLFFSIKRKTDKMLNLPPLLTGVIGSNGIMYYNGPGLGEDTEVRPRAITLAELAKPEIDLKMGYKKISTELEAIVNPQAAATPAVVVGEQPATEASAEAPAAEAAPAPVPETPEEVAKSAELGDESGDVDAGTEEKSGGDVEAEKDKEKSAD